MPGSNETFETFYRPGGDVSYIDLRLEEADLKLLDARLVGNTLFLWS